MKICIFYTSPKLGDLFLQLPFIKAIAKNNNQKVSIFINKHLSIKKILEKQDYIDEVFENSFRRGKFFLIDTYKIFKDLKLKNFSHVYIFEKTKGAAIACKLAGINKIYGFGIGSQKYFVERSVRLIKDDLRYNYTEQSIKFLKQLNIAFNFNDNFLVLDNQNKNRFIKKFMNLPKPWVCFSVDSTEINRIWPQENFAKLGDKLIEKKLAKTIFVVNYENHKNYFKEVINNSRYQNQFINCKHLNRSEIIHLIDICEFFVGIDSGPSCVSGALNKKTFCIIGPTDMTLPRFISMKKIVSDIYDKRREVGLKRCGDNFVKNDSEVKTIGVQKVFDTIIKNL
tara:strand:+ start:1829 stop:2848 length:1020 start_codon:yes stop_codon:yes gene_type:complete